MSLMENKHPRDDWMRGGLSIGAAACGLFLFVTPGLWLGMNGTLRFYSTLLDAYTQMDRVIANYNSHQFLVIHGGNN